MFKLANVSENKETKENNIINYIFLSLHLNLLKMQLNPTMKNTDSSSSPFLSLPETLSPPSPAGTTTGYHMLLILL